jgi:hypothetical protein
LSRLQSVQPERTAAVDVYSFSGEADYPEQAASIRTFLRFVGEPRKFVVISDGTHSARTRELLEGQNPCVSVMPIELVLQIDLPSWMQAYALLHPMGKKLSILYSLRVDQPTIYCDSDILYFPKASQLHRLFASAQTHPYFLLDCWPSLDTRLLVDEAEKTVPVNGGFLLWGGPLHWEEALRRFDRMEGQPGFFTEQTAVHLTMKASGATPLPSDQFILRAEDQFSLLDAYASRDIALRHYISSIRTKFWHHWVLYG